MKFELLARCALLIIAGVETVSAQQFPFQLRVVIAGNASAVQNGGSVAFDSPIGQSETASVTATYSGAGQVAISQGPIASGSSAFTVSAPGALPAILTPGQAFTFSAQFLPTNAAQNLAQVVLPYTETVSGTNSTGSIVLSLQGAAPSFVLSYVLQSTQNATPLQAGGTITFPATQINTVAQAALNVTNAGSGTGVVTGVSITGSAFKLAGVPLLPANVTAGQNLPLSILYQPTGTTADTGQVQITYTSGSVTVTLQGNGSAPHFTYQVLQTNPPTTVPSGGTVPLPSTNVGQTTSVVIRVLNSGNASGAVTQIAVTGQGFQTSNVPPLPQTLAPNASFTFTVGFTPTQPGNLTGTLLINSDTLTLSGVGLGAQLVFSYVAAGSTIGIGPTSPSVVFSPVMITQSSQLSFDVKNTGTLPATISNIGITQSPSPFTLTGIPPLPVTVTPNADFHVTIVFTPTAIGFSNGTLQFDATTVPLVGSGTQPPPLPSYTISGASGNTAPLSQPSIGLALSASYPVAITGTLALAVSSNLSPDPAVQFSSGGVSVPFVIPANSTAAVFAGQGPQIGLQTGTVASMVTLTPSFATQAGGVSLTPANPTTLQFTVAPAAPVLLGAQIGSVTATGFALTLTGFSTTRSLATCTVQFGAATGFHFPTTQFQIDLTQVSTLWFQSATSKASGGEFSLTIPFTLQGTAPTGETLVNSVSSVSASVSNGTGVSNVLQSNVR